MAKENEELIEKLGQLEETLIKIKSDLDENKKRNKIRFYVTWGIFGLILTYILWFYVMVNAFVKEVSSEDFLNMAQQKTMEVTPVIAQKLGQTLQETAPKIYDQLEGKLNNFLPQLADKLSNDILPKFLDQLKERSDIYMEDIRSKADQLVREFINENLEEIRNGVNLTLGDMEEKSRIDDSQLEEIKDTIVAKLQESVEYYIKDKMESSINLCVEKGENIFNSLDEFKYLPSEERSSYAFSMFRGFVDGLEYLNTGKVPNTVKPVYGSFNQNSKEQELYDLYMQKSSNGSVSIKNLPNQEWWKEFEQTVRSNVYSRLQKEGYLY